MKKTIIAFLFICLGVVLSLAVPEIRAGWNRVSLVGQYFGDNGVMDRGSPDFFVFWDETEQVNCYVTRSSGSVTSPIWMECIKK